MLKTDSGNFNEFVGKCVNEVKVNSDMAVKWLWFWLGGDCKLPTWAPYQLQCHRISSPQPNIKRVWAGWKA